MCCGCHDPPPGPTGKEEQGWGPERPSGMRPCSVGRGCCWVCCCWGEWGGVGQLQCCQSLSWWLWKGGWSGAASPPRVVPSAPARCQGRGTQVLWCSARTSAPAPVHAQAAPAPLLECTVGQLPAPQPGCRAEVLSWGVSLLPLPLSALPSYRSTALCSPPTACSPAGSGGGSSSSLLWVGANPPFPLLSCSPGVGAGCCVHPSLCPCVTVPPWELCWGASHVALMCPPPPSHIWSPAALPPVLSLPCELWCCSTGSLALLGWDQTLSHCSHPPIPRDCFVWIGFLSFIIFYFLIKCTWAEPAVPVPDPAAGPGGAELSVWGGTVGQRMGDGWGARCRYGALGTAPGAR